MALEKRPADEIFGKLVVTKEGKRIGVAKDITFETRSGELIQIEVASPTAYAASLNLEKSRDNNLLVPFAAIVAIGDFVVVSEEEMR